MNSGDISSDSKWRCQLFGITICTSEVATYRDLLEKSMKFECNGPFHATKDEMTRVISAWGLEGEHNFNTYYLASGNPSPGLVVRILEINSRSALNSGTPGLDLNALQSLNFLTNKTKKLSKSLEDNQFKSNYKKKKAQYGQRSLEQSQFVGPDHFLINHLQDREIEGSPFPTLNSVDLSIPDVDSESDFFYKVLAQRSVVNKKESNSINASFKKNFKKVSSVKVVQSEALSDTALRLVQMTKESKQEKLSQPPSLQRRGWLTFESNDIGETLSRAHAGQFKVYKTPRKVGDPFYGEAIAMSLHSPSGLLIEVFNRL